MDAMMASVVVGGEGGLMQRIVQVEQDAEFAAVLEQDAALDDQPLECNKTPTRGSPRAGR